MTLLANIFSLILAGLALFVGIPLFSGLFGLLVVVASATAYIVFRLQRAKRRPFLAILRRAFWILAAVLAVCALPGFLFACSGRLNEFCILGVGPLLGSAVLAVLLALLTYAVEALMHRQALSSKTPEPSPKK